MKRIIFLSFLAIFSNVYADYNLPSDGAFISYHANGKLALIGEVKERKKTGIWKFYYDTGQLQAKEIYGHGKAIGTWQYFNEDGKLLWVQTFRKDNFDLQKRAVIIPQNGTMRSVPTNR